MTSKTFKSAWPNHPRRINIREIEDGVNVRIADPQWEDKKGITLAPSDIPAIMLALGEAAGWPEADPRSATKQIMMWLGDVVRTVERITAEAEAQAKLEAEARDFYEAYHSAADWPYQDWATLEDRYKAQFLAVARRAREMRAEK